MKKDSAAKIIAILMLVGGLLAVLAPGFSDYAKHAFWWKAWDVLSVAGVAAFVGGFVWLVNLNKSAASSSNQA